MYVLVHGVRCPDDVMYGSVFIAGWRVGDVTVWYQSPCCSMGLNGAMKDVVIEAGFLSTQQRLEVYDSKLPQKIV